MKLQNESASQLLSENKSESKNTPEHLPRPKFDNYLQTITEDNCSLDFKEKNFFKVLTVKLFDGISSGDGKLVDLSKKLINAFIGDYFYNGDYDISLEELACFYGALSKEDTEYKLSMLILIDSIRQTCSRNLFFDQKLKNYMKKSIIHTREKQSLQKRKIQLRHMKNTQT